MSRRSKQARDQSDRAASGPSKRPDVHPGADGDAETEALVRRHLRFGWRSLLFFLLLGLFLEGLHGFKIGWYLDVSHATRRHMWTLAHAHGTLLAVLNLMLAATIRLVPGWSHRLRGFASVCLLSSAILLPVGFFLGGCFTYDGDPGIGIVLVPVGAVLLITAVLLAARS